jgi:hypothetical protein
MLVDVLSAVPSAPSGVDEGSSEESMSDTQSLSLQEAEELVDENSRELVGDGFFKPPAQDSVGDGKNSNSTAQSKSEVQHLRNRLRTLALSSNHPSMKVPEGGRLSIWNFILLDIHHKFRGLLPPLGHVDGARKQDKPRQCSAHSFMRFLNNATTQASKTIKDRIPLLDEVRKETLMPGKCVCQEVGDLLLQFMCSFIGADFYDSSHRVNEGNDPWPSLKAYRKPEDPRFLVFSTQAAASISLFVRGKSEKSIKKWVDSTSKVLSTYAGSSWAVPNDNHYTSVTMRLDASIPSKHVMRCTQADSLTRGGNYPQIDDGLRRGFVEICKKTAG